ncbi:MAG: TlpA family protein disulfide reductase [Aeromicrobium sp.]
MRTPPTPKTGRLLLAASLVVLAAGCGGPETNGTKGGYVSGEDRLIVRVDPADRKKGPVISGDDLNGDPVSTADFKGKTIVVNVWGSWCPPCRKEAAALDAVARKMKPKGVEFLGIAVREDAATTLAFTKKRKISYPSISDTTGHLLLGFTKSLPSQAIPTTWIIDSSGRVAARILNDTTASTLTGLIEDVQASIK